MSTLEDSEDRAIWAARSARAAAARNPQQPPQPQIQPCRYKTGKTLGAGSYSVVKECVHIDTGRCYAAKVINKRLMAGREHMVRLTRTTPAARCFSRLT